MHNTLVKEFIKFAVKELQLKTLPNSIKFASSQYANQHRSFGTYSPDDNAIVIVEEGRHLADTLRTLGHELVHHKQREEGRTMNGDTGSELENEANAMAGVLMRTFRDIHPEIFNLTPTAKDKLSIITSIAKSGKPAKIDEQYIDVFTARLLATVMHKLTPENKQKFLSESVDKMVAVAYKIVTQ